MNPPGSKNVYPAETQRWMKHGWAWTVGEAGGQSHLRQESPANTHLSCGMQLTECGLWLVGRTHDQGQTTAHSTSVAHLLLLTEWQIIVE